MQVNLWHQAGFHMRCRVEICVQSLSALLYRMFCLDCYKTLRFQGSGKSTALEIVTLSAPSQPHLPCLLASSVGSLLCTSAVLPALFLLCLRYSQGTTFSLVLYFLCFILMWIEEIRIWYLWNVWSDARLCSSLIAEATALAPNYSVQSLIISFSYSFHAACSILTQQIWKNVIDFFFPAVPLGISYCKDWGNPLKQNFSQHLF